MRALTRVVDMVAATAVNGAATVGDAPGEELSDEACAAGGQPGDAYGDEHCCVDDP